MNSLKVNNQIYQFNNNIDQDYVTNLIVNCPILQERKLIYTDHKRNFSATFIRSSTHYHKQFYHYYRVQIVEPSMRGREVKKYEVEEIWGTLETSDHRKRTEKYLRDAAVQIFLFYTSEAYVNDKFSTVISLTEEKSLVNFSFEKLLIDIINCDVIVRIILEHELLLKNLKNAFLKICVKVFKNNRFMELSIDQLPEEFSNEDSRLVRKIIQRLLTRRHDLPLNHKSTQEVANFLNIFYLKLGTRIELLDPSTEYFKIIQKYVKNTQSPQHKSYTLRVQNIFNIFRPDDRGLFMDQIGNKKLLWHGTRKENIASILAKGFQVPRRPSHGRMFGHGMYFSNSVSKAANYCGCDRKDLEGYLLLCEIALGNTMELYEAKTDTWMLPLGIHSIVGKGQLSPYANDSVVIYQDVQVPYGEIVKNVFSPNTGLIHDEFIVFTTSQIRIRHLVAVKFEFKDKILKC